MQAFFVLLSYIMSSLSKEITAKLCPVYQFLAAPIWCVIAPLIWPDLTEHSIFRVPCQCSEYTASHTGVTHATFAAHM